MVTFPDILLLSSPKLIHLYMVLLLHLLEIIFPGARILQYWQQFMTFSLLEQFAERKIGSRVFLQDTLLQNIRVFISLERFSFCLFLFCNLMEIDWSDFMSYANKVVLSSAANLREEEFSFCISSHKSKQHWWVLNGRNSCMLQRRWFLLFAFVICKLFFQYVT